MRPGSRETRTVVASAVQRQFWLLQRMQPNTTAYHVPSVFRLQGALDPTALRSAFSDLVARHESLRTTFEERDGEVLQCIHPEAPACFIETSAASLPILPEIEAEIRQPFDLAQGPLMRARLWRSADERQFLAWTMHHIITDLSTKDMLSRQLEEAYARRLRGGERPHDQQLCQYSSFAQAEANWRQSDSARAAADYFATHLDSTTPALALAEDFPRPVIQSPRGARVGFALDERLGGMLELVANEQRTKPFLLLLTAYALLLAKYSGANRIILGIPFTNRRWEDSQNCAGCFVNTLPTQIDLSETQSFRQLCDQIRKTMLGHHRHQEISFDQILGRVRPPRDASRNPLYQAGFTFEHPMQLHLPGVTADNLKLHAGGAQLDLFMTMWERDGRYAGYVEYCSDLFQVATIERLVRNYLTVLESALRPEVSSSSSASAVEYVHERERELVVDGFNRTAVDFQRPALMHRLFLEQVERTPDAIAVRKGLQRLTYRELAEYANALASSLGAQGVQKGDRVGIYMHRSLEMQIAVFAVLLAGAAYVPIDPEFPSQRIQHVLEDAQPKCVLGLAHLAGQWTQASIALTVVDLGTMDRCAEAPRTHVRPEDAAYVIFTSGSTGRPKGVAVSHRAICNAMLWMQATFRLQVDDVLVQTTPYSFDVSTWELLWVFIVGAQLEVPEEGIHRDPRALAKLIETANVTTIHFVPSMLQVYLDQASFERCPSLRRVLCIGEALGSELVRRFHQACAAELHNLYGPTEAAVQASWWRCDPGAIAAQTPIGKPIANTKFYILDGRLQPTPIGVPGELFIGGTQVANEYVNRADLTARAFLPDPFSPDPNARMYRTGDLARWLPDGNVVFLGRTDFQVKIRGLRIELGEIEAVLDRHPLVAQSVVIARRVDGGMDAQLIAYLAGLSRSDAAVVDGVRAYAAEHLPNYMVPNRFIVLEQLPVSANGKIDRKALPVPLMPESRIVDCATNDMERWLCQQWCELLEVQQIGIHQSFFEVGGTSLMAVRLMSRIREKLAVEVALVRLFEYPTVARLCAYLGSLTKDATTVAALSKAKEHASNRRSQVLRQSSKRSRR